ncbi:acyltransferase [Mesorhizobium sp. B2-7-2]|uniref:acyltransferase family protein n=1 Tax=Mesorhizobium sp. B2-7-2 TaxID=2589908 RepID=UPI00112AF587|nr:acyltransferase [Mesorhizobium sp. B2-7-2]TPJ28391.1 acyltransferase [Mesorhizobium sp. B2-7-2]
MQIEGQGKSRLKYLNALRGLAAMWVLMEHTALSLSPRLYVPDWLDMFVVSGSMGVELFFVVSAFSLCLSMPGHAQEKRPLVGFALRRFFRIAPLFYLVMLLMIIRYPEREFGEIFANVFFVFNFIDGYQPSIVPSGWTIGIEMPFYLVFPFIYARVKNIWHAAAAVVLFIIIGNVYQLALPALVATPSNYILYAAIHKLPIFGFGLLAFHLAPYLAKNPEKRSIGIFLLFSSIAIFMMIQSGRSSLIEPYYWRGAMFCLVVLGFSAAPMPALVNYWTDWLGERSYSIYLVHVPVILILQGAIRAIERSTPQSVSYLVILIVVATCVIAVSAATYSLLERPVNDYGRKVARRLAGAPAVARLAPAEG